MWYEFPSKIILNVSGRDARRYLNNRLSADVKSLSPGTSLRAAALTPQGRVEGVFTVFCVGADEFVLAATGGNGEEVVAALLRYRVADRVNVEDLSAAYRYLHIAKSVSTPASVEGALVAPIARIAESGCDCVARNDAACASLLEGAGSSLSTPEFSRLRFLYGTPLFSSEMNSDAIVTECGGRDLVSFQKGCYVGQEVIERSDAIGRLPRALERVVFEGVAPDEIDIQVTDSEGAQIGRIVTVVPDVSIDSWGAFAMLRTGRYDAGSSVHSGGAKGIVIEHERVLS